MNKYQKIAVQIAKDDRRKNYWNNANIKKLIQYASYTIRKMPYKKAIDFKNWNKTVEL